MLHSKEKRRGSGRRRSRSYTRRAKVRGSTARLREVSNGENTSVKIICH